MTSLYLNKKPVIKLNKNITYNEILSNIHNQLGLELLDYYLLHNGRILNPNIEVKHEIIEIVLRTYGGKGGFGSMLRAIGAQIEKTTNREACRDLSGRRLRDINEEKRLKKWITQQAERGKEAAERKQKRLEKLCETPKHKFEDKNFDDERSLLPEMIEDALTQGLKATCSSDAPKRKSNSETETKRKKQKLWIDSDVDVSSSDSAESDDDNDNSPHTKTSETNSSDTNQPLPNVEEKSHLLEKDIEKKEEKNFDDIIHNKNNKVGEDKESITL